MPPETSRVGRSAAPSPSSASFILPALLESLHASNAPTLHHLVVHHFHHEDSPRSRAPPSPSSRSAARRASVRGFCSLFIARRRSTRRMMSRRSTTSSTGGPSSPSRGAVPGALVRDYGTGCLRRLPASFVAVRRESAWGRTAALSWASTASAPVSHASPVAPASSTITTSGFRACATSTPSRGTRDGRVPGGHRDGHKSLDLWTCAQRGVLRATMTKRLPFTRPCASTTSLHFSPPNFITSPRVLFHYLTLPSLLHPTFSLPPPPPPPPRLLPHALHLALDHRSTLPSR